MKVIEDSNQKLGKHSSVNDYFKSHGIEVIRQRLPVGDYILANEKVEDVFARKEARGIPVKMMDLVGTYNVCVDEKFSIQELVGNICGAQHNRFRDECILAKNNGVKLYVLVENDSEIVVDKKGIFIRNEVITDLKDLHSWVNPRLWITRRGQRLYPSATRGITLKKCCYTMQAKYGVEFHFCASKDAGKKVIELLTQ